MQHAVQVSGAQATGPNAATINGVYRPVYCYPQGWEGFGGKPVYKKDGDDTWIEYWPGREQWQLKPGDNKGRMLPVCIHWAARRRQGWWRR